MATPSNFATRSHRWQFTVRTLLFVMLCVGGTIAGFQFGYYRGQEERRLQSFVTKVYTLADVAPVDAKSGQYDLDAVVDLLTSKIDVESWDDVGGPGSISGFTWEPPTVVVRQSVANHEAIAALLDDLRKAQKIRPATALKSKTLTFKVAKAVEHLGHSTAEGDSSVHPAWYDGCRGRLVDSGEEFLIWWNGNEINDTPFRFDEGRTYAIQFKGELETSVMGFEGKCLHVGKLVKVDRSDK